jgi:hypothetical protein
VRGNRGCVEISSPGIIVNNQLEDKNLSKSIIRGGKFSIIGYIKEFFINILLIRRLHKWSGAEKGENIYKKMEYKLVYLTSVRVVLVEAEDLGSRMEMSFFA